MKNLKELTNIEFLEQVMNFNKFGAIVQPIVIQALTIGLKTMAETKEEALKEYYENIRNGKVYIINLETWYTCIEDIQLQIKENMNNYEYR